MSDQLPAIIPPGALTTPTDTYMVPALIADAGDAAGWRYVEFFTANISNPNTRRAYARACARFFAWCEDRGLTLATDPAVRRGGLGGGAAGETRGAGCEAAARRRADAVRLAHHRPGDADEPGRRRARSEACRENRQDAGARCRRMAQAHRQHSDRDRARSSRPRADRHPHLFVRAHHRGAQNEGGGSAAAKVRAGGSGCTRKAASITRCRAITRSPKRCTPTSPPPASPRIARAGCSAPARGTTPPC